MKFVAPIPMPPNSGRSTVRMMRGRVRPAKEVQSCHQNECLRKSAFKVGLLP